MNYPTNHVSGRNSVVIGQGNTCRYDNCILIGNNQTANYDGHVMIAGRTVDCAEPDRLIISGLIAALSDTVHALNVLQNKG